MASDRDTPAEDLAPAPLTATPCTCTPGTCRYGRFTPGCQPKWFNPTEDPNCPHDSRSGADGRWRCDQCGADCGPNTYVTPTEETSRG